MPGLAAREQRHERGGGEKPVHEDLDVVPDPWREANNIGHHETQQERQIKPAQSRGDRAAFTPGAINPGR